MIKYDFLKKNYKKINKKQDHKVMYEFTLFFFQKNDLPFLEKLGWLYSVFSF